MAVSIKLYHERKVKRLCVKCGQSKESRLIYCDRCKETKKLLAKRKYNRYKSQNRCLRNGCIDKCKCKEKFTEAQKLKRRHRIDNNLCVDCGKQFKIGESRYCIDCFCKSASRSRCGSNINATELRNKLITQNFKCVYSGKVLIPGKNASVDHIIPISCNGTSDPNNLQWVDSQINNMKTNLTHDEFIDTCYKIGNIKRMELINM